MNAPYFEVEHEWEPERTNAVVESVQKWVDKVKRGDVPEGFTPIVMAAAVPGKTEARCTWNAPSQDALEALYVENEIPTQRVIREVSPFHTR